MQKILIQILSFSLIFLALFTLMRFVMVQDFLELSLREEHFSNLFKMYLYGMGSDIRTLSIAFLPLLLCGFLTYLKPFLNKYNMGGGH